MGRWTQSDSNECGQQNSCPHQLARRTLFPSLAFLGTVPFGGCTLQITVRLQPSLSSDGEEEWATEKHRNNRQVDWTAKIKVFQVDLDWQHKSELFLPWSACDTSGHQGRSQVNITEELIIQACSHLNSRSLPFVPSIVLCISTQGVRGNTQATCGLKSLSGSTNCTIPKLQNKRNTKIKQWLVHKMISQLS